MTDRSTRFGADDASLQGGLTPTLALRAREAAKALGISPRMLQKLTHAGEVPHLHLGKAVLYPVRDLERWLSEQAAREVGS